MKSSLTVHTGDALPVPSATWYSRRGKRLLDFTLASCAVVVLSPLILLIAALEIVFHGHPVFYVSVRPGLDEKLFRIYKFRTMTNARDAEGSLLPEAQRLTRFGRMLRRFSLDEMPELFNIVKGDMAIIGPRPLLTEYLCRYSDRHHARHWVRPGLDCPNIRQGLLNMGVNDTWEEQFENDVFYVENVSLKTDCCMLAALAMQVLKLSPRRVTASRLPFEGYNSAEARKTA